jgi:hypothetical protein
MSFSQFDKRLIIAFKKMKSLGSTERRAKHPANGLEALGVTQARHNVRFWLCKTDHATIKFNEG